MAEQVIVVGGGLAGLSAAHTVLEHGGRVLLLDKCPFLGGNSTKATSGINGALTRTQAKAGIDDSADKFEADIIRGAAGVGHTSAPTHTIPLAKVRDLPGGAPRNAASFFLTNPDRARVARYFTSDPRAFRPSLTLTRPESRRFSRREAAHPSIGSSRSSASTSRSSRSSVRAFPPQHRHRPKPKSRRGFPLDATRKLTFLP